MPPTIDDLIERLHSPEPPEPTLDQQGNPVQRIAIDCENLTDEQVDALAEAITSNTWLQRVQLLNCKNPEMYHKFAKAIFQHNARHLIKIERLVFTQSSIDVRGMQELLPLLATDKALKLVVFPNFIHPHVANAVFEHKLLTRDLVFTETGIPGYSCYDLAKFIRGNKQINEIYLRLDLDVSADPKPHFENAAMRESMKKFLISLYTHPELLKIQIVFVEPDQKEQLEALMELVPEVSEETKSLRNNHTAFEFNVEYNRGGEQYFIMARSDTKPSESIRKIINPDKIASFNEFLDVATEILFVKLESYIFSLEQFKDDDDESAAHILYASISSTENQLKIKHVLKELLKDIKQPAEFVAIINKFDDLAIDTGLLKAMHQDLATDRNFGFRSFRRQFNADVFENRAPTHLRSGLS